MKKKLVMISTALIYSAMMVGFSACNDGHDHHDHEGHDHEHHDHEGHDHEGHDHDHEDEAAVYSCPMKCEGDKTYDKAGECPTCGMELEKK